jgi:hypothetical protein
MTDARCTPGRHLGEDVDGRCSVCGDQLQRPSLLLTVLIFLVVVATTTLAVWVLLSWWMGT